MCKCVVLLEGCSFIAAQKQIFMKSRGRFIFFANACGSMDREEF